MYWEVQKKFGINFVANQLKKAEKVKKMLTD